MTNCHNRFLNFHKSWIKPCSETPEQLSYAKATDALVKSLRLIAEPLKIKRAKDLLSELHKKNHRKAGSDLDKLWLGPEKILRENFGINTETKNTSAKNDISKRR
ncbi:unnamed protein product [Rhizophagus irregularis]|nr:unnamed protein product [Rhizophagus irregularis]